MGRAGYVIGIIAGIIVTYLGLSILVGSFTMSGLTSWFLAFFAMFVFIIAAIIFFAASRAKPKKLAQV